MPRFRGALVRCTVCCLFGLVLVSGCARTGDSPGTASEVPEQYGGTQALELSSSALQDGAVIPAEYCGTSVAGGQNRSPSLDWSGAPDETASFVVVMIDEHRVANQWVHWVIVDLPPQTTSLADNATGSLPAPARELRNAYGDEGYGGPTPPPGSGDHPYVITVYALDTTSTDIKDKPSRSQIERAVEGHVLASGTITGYFGR